LERKPHALGFAKPFVGWHLPGCFAVLRDRMEAHLEHGTREYIRVLRLVETQRMADVTAAVEQALRPHVYTKDGLTQFLPDGHHENVLLVGNRGTGKTHLASALGFAGGTQGRRVRFFTVKALVTPLREMTEQRQLERTLRQLERQDILILDELGYVPFSKTGAELLFEVVSRAYERRSLIVTTNLPFESWTEVFGSERLTGALLDRLTHRVHILEANGPSYRLRESKTRLPSGSLQPPESAPADPEKPGPEDVSKK
jgi:DNA replication protein DnaC